jgi:hypothetical protein
MQLKYRYNRAAYEPEQSAFHKAQL